ncbi:MAG TPA: NCS2 family permease [Blastocatellia bacterium]|nr:NCS2 family permease [Blastocatellia bacterium]
MESSDRAIPTPASPTLLERLFQLSANQTTVRTEIIAGFTTFATMSYIIFVNPNILKDAGMDQNAVLAATCIASAVATLVMGLAANYPLALAPGMGVNAYFTYTVVLQMGVKWQTALAAVFISGAVFFILTVAQVRKLIVSAIPQSLHAAVAAGIGLFIAFIGLKNAGIISADPVTFVTLGKGITSKETVISIIGLLITAALMARKITGAILLGIISTTILALVFKIAHAPTSLLALPNLGPTFLKLDLRGAFHLGLLEIIFVFLFVDMFDNIGTLVGVTRQAGLMNEKGEIPRINRVLLADASGSMVGALCGTSTVTSYIESAAGVAAGGKTGLTAVIVALLFLISLFFAPIVSVVPAIATAPALIIVGSLMMKSILDIDWKDTAQSIPAFLTIIAIPLTFNIANGLALGFVSYPVIMALSGRWREVSWAMYILALIFVLRYVYLGIGA